MSSTVLVSILSLCMFYQHFQQQEIFSPHLLSSNVMGHNVVCYRVILFVFLLVLSTVDITCSTVLMAIPCLLSFYYMASPVCATAFCPLFD